MDDFSVFCYRQGDSIFHRMPSWIKILFIPAFNIALFSLDWKVSAFFIVFQIILFFILKFTVFEQLKDLKPVIYYVVFLYMMYFFIQLYTFWGMVDWTQAVKIAFENSIKDKDTGIFCLRFCACVQSCSLMFKTSTSLQIRGGIEDIETAIRKFLPVQKEAKFAFAVAMLINFIPTVFKIWTQLKRAWFARGGKNNLKMVLVLIPKLFSLGLNFAFNTTKALINRGQK